MNRLCATREKEREIKTNKIFTYKSNVRLILFYPNGTNGSCLLYRNRNLPFSYSLAHSFLRSHFNLPILSHFLAVSSMFVSVVICCVKKKYENRLVRILLSPETMYTFKASIAFVGGPFQWDLFLFALFVFCSLPSFFFFLSY